MKRAVDAFLFFGLMIASSVIGFTMLAGISSGIFHYERVAGVAGLSFAFVILWAIYGVSRFTTDDN